MHEMNISVTGANGHLGVRLVAYLLGKGAMVRALVRSERARQNLAESMNGIDTSNLSIHLVDYTGPDTLESGLKGTDCVVHLAGIIRESSANRYIQAHEKATACLLAAVDTVHVPQFIYLSILGSDPQSANSCLSSKGKAERMVLNFERGSVLRVPMVLGEGDYAAKALLKKAKKIFNLTLRGESKEQPVYAGDVVEAVASLIRLNKTGSFDLAGPQSLSRTDLIFLSAQLLERRTFVVSLPFLLGWSIVRLMEMVLPNPPVTTPMLEILDHDDCINPAPVCESLEITLTTLEDMLRKVLLCR